MTKSNEQLSRETDALFKKLDEHKDGVSSVKEHLSQLSGQIQAMTSLIQEMVNNHSPAIQALKIHHEQTVDRIRRIEQDYVSRQTCKMETKRLERIETEYIKETDIATIMETVAELKKNLRNVAYAFVIPLIAIAVGVIYN